ncbi:unnamed protein product [Vitrella brassicaformis CCMP3155]|uniref:Thioredoxin domain-containing protein n=2 Tax=Vitrella brassicaformis TaxID=1169539 RepID=A0A0G4FAB9_VITBC|nr:unnamed protein product [Vitrella brassicaformis CCMP3155]|mmetsp:Transcript_7562/g.18474  ORF Transcript_7562/g.18474 Transcript_7562/m.18474 type:complete len:216 (+) Transcript_7562:119-766(+)|eukprot:CEM09881.1 unnamed protein product [Vitrella brassicaformis CCMP3155]
MILRCTAASFLLLLGTADVATGDSTAKSAVRVLTDANFEHDTQASSGATTGDWFIEFYANWCGHCQRLQPTWEELAANLKGRVVVAKVDCDANTSTRSRFNIQGFPTLLLLRQGRMYEYKGARDLAALEAFATGGYKKTPGKPVPPPESLLDQLKKEAMLLLDMSMRFAKEHPVHVGVAVGVSVMLGTVFSLLMMVLTRRKRTGGEVAPEEKKTE